MSEGRGSGRWAWWRSVWFVVPLVVVWLVPVAVLLVAEPAADRAQAAAAEVAQPEVVTVGSRGTPASHGVVVQLTFSPSYQVISRRAGTVTAIGVKTGDEPAQGAALLAIDGVPVLAYRSDTPFYRDLARGSRGPDVTALGQYLQGLGLVAPSAVGDVFGSGLQAGVKALQTRLLGVPATGQFAADDVAFFPATAGAVASVDVQLGQDVSAGAGLLTLSGQPTGVHVVDATSGQPFAMTGTGWSLQAGADTLPVPDGGFDASSIPALQKFVAAAVASGALDVVGSQGTDPAGGAGTDASTVGYSGAMAVQATPAGSGTVPSSAVYVGADGTPCVVVSQSGYQVVALTSTDLVAGEVGVVAVPAQLVGASVVRDPSVLDPTVLASCASR